MYLSYLYLVYIESQITVHPHDSSRFGLACPNPNHLVVTFCRYTENVSILDLSSPFLTTTLGKKRGC